MALTVRATACAGALLAATLLAGCGEKKEDIGTTATTSGEGVEIAGDWTGELSQKGLKPFGVAVRIQPPGASEPTRVAYTGIDCAGEWAPSESPAVFVFTETITEGAGGDCKGTGTVTLTPQPAGAPTALSYAFSGGGVQSSGVLSRTDAAGLAPVFAQAGVAPPP